MVEKPPSPFAQEVGLILFKDKTPEERTRLLQIAATYDWTTARYGAKHKAVLWTNKGGQIYRFKLLAKLLKHEKKGGASINDLGCGYGAFFTYLKKHKALKNGRYTGYDLSHRLIAEANKKIDDPRAFFLLDNKITHEADYSFASGTFGLKLDTDDATWTEEVKRTLLQMASMSRKGMGFNLLDRNNAEHRSGLYYANKEDILAFCQEEIGGNITEIPVYKDKEFTVLIRFD